MKISVSYAFSKSRVTPTLLFYLIGNREYYLEIESRRKAC